MGFLSWLRGSKSTEHEAQLKKVPPKRSEVSRRMSHMLPEPESSWEEATVKRRLSSDRGYSFLTRGEGKSDIYIHSSLLGLCGIKVLQEGQKVEVRYAKVQRGLEAGEVRLLK